MEKEFRELVEKFIGKYDDIMLSIDLYDLKELFKLFAKRNNYNDDLRVKAAREAWDFVKNYYLKKGNKANA